MLQKTRGIVINYIRYRETSIIVKIYTEESGIQSYIENSVRSTKAKNKIALFQPLTLLDLVVYHREQSGLSRISEIKCNTPFSSIPYDFMKTTIALFITEILGKTLKEETGNSEMFSFIFDSILYLDKAEQDFENFHLQFLLKLSSYLGFAPQSAEEIFDQLSSAMTLQLEDAQLLNALIESPYWEPIKVSHQLRRKALNTILTFYSLHIENFGEIKSLQVLQEVTRQ